MTARLGNKRYTKREQDFATIRETKQLIDDRLRQVLPGVIQGVVVDYEAHRQRNVWWQKLWRRFVPPPPPPP